MEAADLLSRLDALDTKELLEYFAASRRVRADVIQEYYAAPATRAVAENLIELEINDQARSVVISLLRERSTDAVGF